MIDLRDRTIQKSRIAFSNRVGAIERGVDDGDLALVERWKTRFDELENELDGDIRELVKDVEIVEHMTALKGIGGLLAAKMISMIDIERADTVSALWRYAGYAVINGEREKPQKGEKLHYNIRLKTTLYLVGSSFLRCGSPYREIYDLAREYYENNRADWTKLHKHNAAMRKMIKIFLSHLWLQWRELENLAISQPYIFNDPKHNHQYERLAFGWPSLNEKKE